MKQTVEVSLPVNLWAVSLCRPFPAIKEQSAYRVVTPHASRMVEFADCSFPEPSARFSGSD